MREEARRFPPTIKTVGFHRLICMKIGEKIQLLEKALTEANNDRNMAIAQEGVLKTELESQFAKCRELGVDPGNLETEITRLLTESNELLSQVTDLLPQEYLAKVGL